MEKIYIIQTYSKTFLATIVKLVTKNQYSHIMLSLDDSFNEMYGFGRIQALNPFWGGYVVQAKNSFFYNLYRNTKCRIFVINVNKRQKEKIRALLKKFKKNKKDYSYDFLGLILRYLKFEYHPKKKYVCSNFVGYLLDKSNIYHFKKNVYEITPKDFNTLDNASVYYEGLLKNI